MSGSPRHEYECIRCGIRITGIERADGRVYADDKHESSGLVLKGLCMSCYEESPQDEDGP